MGAESPSVATGGQRPVRNHRRERSVSGSELEVLVSRAQAAQQGLGGGDAAPSPRLNRLPESRDGEDEGGPLTAQFYTGRHAGGSGERSAFEEGRARSMSANLTSASRLARFGSSHGDMAALVMRMRGSDLQLRSPSFRAGVSSGGGASLISPASPKSPPSIPSIGGQMSTYGSTAQDDAESGTWGGSSTDMLNAQTPLLPANAADFAQKEGPTVQKVIESLIYGVVNSILTIPCMYGYAAIIFRHPAFKDDIAALSKLVLLSSMVHQCIFTGVSSLSFSIGQVQDAGLLFLSTMATAIAKSASSREAIIPTTLIALSLATTLLGVVVFALGRLKLAKLVAYLPMPVVGGYLAFIGLFCMLAGIGLSIGEDVSHVSDVTKVDNLRALKLLTPALLGGLLLAVAARKAKHWFTLPLCIVAMPLAFYALMFASGMSLADAQAAGWLSKPDPASEVGPFWTVWELFDFALIDWARVPEQAVAWISMVFVVSFSSCLDVVAIEYDLGAPLNIDHELCTVGISNMISGIAGGYTGSYIFSQTIFTFRTGTNSRLVGIVVIISEAALFMAPINVMEIVPLFFFASTLIFIAFDLMMEWLIEVFPKISIREYAVLLSTFLVISATSDLILGIAIGIGLSIVNFIIAYSSVTHIQRTYRVRSNVVRDFESRRKLKQLSPCVARLDLHGYLFFGSSMQVVKKLQILIDEKTAGAHGHAAADDGEGGTRNSLEHDTDGEHDHGPDASALDFVTSLVRRFNPFASGSTTGPHTPEWAAVATGSHRDEAPVSLEALNTPAPGHITRQLSRQTSISADPEIESGSQLRFLVLDFTRVTGMDATAVSTGMMRVKQVAVTHGLRIVFTSMRPEFERLLVANHIVIPDDHSCECVVYHELNDALAWIEDELLEDETLQSLTKSPRTPSTKRELPTMPNIPYAFEWDGHTRNKIVSSLQSMQDPSCTIWLRRILVDFFGFDTNFEFGLDDADLGEYTELTQYFGLMRLRAGEYVFRSGDLADAIYIVLVGEVCSFVPREQILERLVNKHDHYWRSQFKPEPRMTYIQGGKLLQRAQYGCIFGDIHFTLNERRQFSAVATEEAAIFVLRRQRLMELESRNPKLAVGLYRCLTKYLSLTVSDLQSYKRYTA
ncbi:Hypothetical Protein FCC1311_065562 [Hondaea fermentalgiana]|uniref:Sulfate transporter n=1 Tax=Hondaea fermentalgiana TaxID=2315210 RepID=A0A2R5GHF6_9STRA|nr:Hypothetical Protein FCC1311_065562 [Hondaea fermentalgiana]|eukprot:GBG30337.1 Hypothetical Protein FCC1311_065562 [Hondaea fermentalgiana]